MILYRDDVLVAADKPSGLLVHRGWARDRDVLMMRVRDEIGAYVYPLHRLDRGTSGVVLFALDAETARKVNAEFAEGHVQKRYVALVRGVPAEEGCVDHAIPRTEGGPRVRAVTMFHRLATYGRYSLVELRPETGRLHQIRRHMKHISCPLIGDVKYGKGEHNRLFRSRYSLHRLALHAVSLSLEHPVTGEILSVEAPVPHGLGNALAALAADYDQSIAGICPGLTSGD